MSMSYVILGMHRTRSSLVAKMLDTMGISMGDEMLGANKHNPYGHWEDTTFYQLNREILFSAGGHWADPPPEERIKYWAPWVTADMRWICQWKSDRYSRWGFKDPRTILTIPVWERFLPDPGYVILKRDRDAVIDSLDGRAKDGGAGSALGMDRNDWADLYDEYDARLRMFLKQNERPAIGIDTDLLMSRSTAPDECVRLADFVGGDPRIAYECIVFKED